jgi:4-amino-4-deoxy-L-arabinose transferase-like glycosyltransferase
VAAVFGWGVTGRLTLANDEGIYLEGARRVLQGEVPYRDFFVLTGPAAFWMNAAAFALLGETLRAGRLTLVLALAVLAAGVYWLTAKMAGRATAAVAAAFFITLSTANFGSLHSNHRWDSSAFAVAATMLAAAAHDRGSRRLWMASGALAAWAAWCTPTVLAVVVALAVWVAVRRDSRGHCPAYCAGVVLASAPPAIYLLCNGALVEMARHLLWSRANYPRANSVGYGWIIGGYGGVLRDASGAEWALRLALLAFVALPAYLPLLNFAVWPLKMRDVMRRDPRVLLVLTAGFGLWLSAYPWFLGHLNSVAAPSFALAAALLHQTLRQGRVYLAFGLSFCSAAFLWGTLRPAWTLPAEETRVGRVQAEENDLVLARTVGSLVQPGDSLFVFPYKPVIYFLTGGRNPTRYSFLQAGMMTDQDERSVLQDLHRRPPRWVFYEYIPPESYLRIWPGSDPSRLRFHRLEDHFQTRYRVEARVRQGSGEFRLLRLPEE